MPFFAFLRCGGHSSAGRRQCRGESAFDARLPCTSAVPFRSDDCPSVARCAEKGSGFLGVPGLSFFGSKESQAPAGDDSNAADMRKKVLQDAVARENEEAPEPAKKPQSDNSGLFKKPSMQSALEPTGDPSSSVLVASLHPSLCLFSSSVRFMQLPTHSSS